MRGGGGSCAMNDARSAARAESLAGVTNTAPLAMSAGALRFSLGLLFVVNILNFLDRQIVSMLAEPIKLELGLADWQLGAMTGFAFALFYTVLGLPIARLAERANRPVIIAASITAWSGFTALCGMAQSFWQLVAARIGVGAGEAGCTPAAHSLISDYVSREKRASALALYAAGTPVGSVLGFMIGGLVADLWGWRAAFYLCGVPGLLVGLLVFVTLPEPRRMLARTVVSNSHPAANLLSAVAELRGSRTFWMLALGAAMTGVVGYGGGAFLPSFFFRNHGEQLAQLGARFGMQPASFLGVSLGLAAGVAGILGTLLGGKLADRFGPRNARAYALIPAGAALVCFPFYIYAMLTGSVVSSILAMGLVNLLITVWSGPVYAAVQGLVQSRTRATAVAVLLLMINLVGLGLGPLLLGIVSDFVSGSLGLGPAEGVRWAQVAITLAGFGSAACFWAASSTISAELRH